jgi:hypothetical protein
MTPQSVKRQPARNSIKLHIEHLVLHGFAPADRHRIADRVQSELARLMGEGRPMQYLQGPFALERIEAGTFKVAAGASPRATGTQIAHAIYRSLQQSATAPGGLPGSGASQPAIRRGTTIGLRNR